MKQKIRVSVAKWDSYELDGPLTDVIQKLQGLIDDNPLLFDFNMDIESESGYYNSCSTNITIDANRWETDEEEKTRLELAKQKAEQGKIDKLRKEKTEEMRQRSLYESLKKKFESEIDQTSKPLNPSPNE